MKTRESSIKDNHDLHSKVAHLESKIDMLEAELSYLNEMLMRCGFPEGIITLKETVEELLAEDAVHFEQRKERPSSDR